jgi:DNA-3-methyladenine glycosylase I
MRRMNAIAIPAGPDARIRCAWGDSPDPAYRAYHDEEWGVPVRDERHLFELLILEGAQAGLSWSTILHKRDGYRAAFADFDVRAVAAFGEEDTARLLADAGIVRNRAKIDATIENARVFLELAARHGSFAGYLRSVVTEPSTPLPRSTRGGDIPATTPVSDTLSADLKRHGMRFVGPTIVYAFMQSVGLVDDHLPECFRYRGQGALRAPGGGAARSQGRARGRPRPRPR